MSEDDARDDDSDDAAGRLATGRWDLTDFLHQLRVVRKMGPFKALLARIPGMDAAMYGAPGVERELLEIEAIILSMTPHERTHPECLDRPRLRRIALGSGTSELAVRRLIKQFRQMKQAVRQLDRDGPDGPRPAPPASASRRRG